jgi:hypothetical protein
MPRNVVPDCIYKDSALPREIRVWVGLHARWRINLSDTDLLELLERGMRMRMRGKGCIYDSNFFGGAQISLNTS